MKPLTRQTALDCTTLHHTKVTRYFNDGVAIFLPTERWKKWMQSTGKDTAHEGKAVQGGVVVRRLNKKVVN